MDGIDRAANKPLVSGVAVTTEGAERGLEQIEALAAVKTEAVAVGLSVMVNGLHYTRCSLIDGTVNLVVVAVTVATVNAEEGRSECAAITDAGTCSHAIGLRQLLNVAALE